jgi:hypothetical protein
MIGENKMMNQEELLQERLELLEAGMPLDDCLHGLPEELAEVLTLAVSLQELPAAQSAAVQADQRDNLLSLAAVAPVATINGHEQREGGQTNTLSLIAFWGGIQAWMQRRTATEWLVTAVMSPALLVLLVAGLWFLLNQNEAPAPIMPEAVVEQQPDTPLLATDEPETAVDPTDTTESPAELVSEIAAPADQAVAFLPIVGYPLREEPQTAILRDIRGQVQVSQGEDNWRAVVGAAHVQAGQHVRTGTMSGATLTFYDGSYATIGPDSEIVIDVVEALRPEEGFRTLVMTQLAGESEHHVEFRNDAGSLYEVKTAQGSGVARGTTFHVLVLPDDTSRFVVTEGRVDVSGNGRTVNVLAGQLTTIETEQTPTSPTFYISGEGEVTAIEENLWTIAGQTFETHANTLIWGDPQVGDLVFVDGRLLSDGTKLADRIILLYHGLPINQFTLTGEVESMGIDSWLIAGQTIILDDETEIGLGIEVGSLVQVDGVITEDGLLLARQISLIMEAPGYPFSFTGIVQAINQASWMVAGQTIAIDDETSIDEDIEVGDLVQVTGYILEDNTWLAVTIKRQEEGAATFTFTGAVESIDPWQVAGIEFEIRDWTIIDPGIVNGDLVRVSGTILSDGTLVAATIQKLTGLEDQTIILVGIVNSINPWIVNNLTLFVDGETIIGEGISVGSLVRVELRLLPDGTWRTVSILPLQSAFGLGCFIIHSTVVSYSSSQLVLANWPAIPVGQGVQVMGNPVPNSIISVQICIAFDGSLIIINNLIIIIHQVIVAPPPGPGIPPAGDGKVTICKVPPGNPAARHTIQVSPPAVQAHLGSGSYLGPCR